MLQIYLAAADSAEDKSLIEFLYTEYKQLMYKTAVSILHNNEGAEDAVKTEFHSYYDTERFELEEIMIGEHAEICLGGERVNIAWDNGDYILEISADLDKSDALKLAKSVKVLEN